jgi:magnesium chelatase subunit I
MNVPTSLGALREAVAAGRVPHRRSKTELRENLIAPAPYRPSALPGIVGYDDTVVPQVVTAILSKHNFILLGPARPGEDASASGTDRPARAQRFP